MIIYIIIVTRRDFMLQLKNVVKTYHLGNLDFMALKGINLNFKQGEFVSILGPSGSGKTTLLNLIGGLDHYTSGDLIINGKSTREFTVQDWDSYRNHSIGFIFQNYNLIHHISILENVEMGMTLSGVSKEARRNKALQVLKRVGLADHIEKKPNQLSGGQKQRVAIARALANDPEVILADEPTGALDSKTSVEVMELIQEIAKEKLVIMVTHNDELAYKYSNRIVKLLDGNVVDDSRPLQIEDVSDLYKPKKISMHFRTALDLSFNNLRTKKIRSLITAFAASIGIIGIALVLAISNGFSANVKTIEQQTFSDYPIRINKYQMIDASSVSRELIDEDIIIPFDSQLRNRHKNIFNQEYLNHIEELDPELYTVIQHVYGARDTILSKGEDVRVINPTNLGWSALFENEDVLLTNYDLLSGRLPESENEIVVVIDHRNQLDYQILRSFNLPIEEELTFDDLLGKELVLAYHDDIYIESNGRFSVRGNLEEAYENGEKLEVVGIIRGKQGSLHANNRGVYYMLDLKRDVITSNMSSRLCEIQFISSFDVISGQPFDSATNTLEDALERNGCLLRPVQILIYPSNYNAKEEIKAHLDAYNERVDALYRVHYHDVSEGFVETLNSMIIMISTILVVFASILLLVSLLQIGIITYVFVLERTKEIGILRSLGARKKDIFRVFNAETIIIGFVAGVLGMLITYILSFPLNVLLPRYAEGLQKVVRISPLHAFSLIAISVFLTLLSGLIPARIAANKNPVEALRHNE